MPGTHRQRLLLRRVQANEKKSSGSDNRAAAGRGGDNLLSWRVAFAYVARSALATARSEQRRVEHRSRYDRRKVFRFPAGHDLSAARPTATKALTKLRTDTDATDCLSEFMQQRSGSES